MKISHNICKLLSVAILGCLILFVSCQTETDVDPNDNETEGSEEEENNNNGNGNPGGEFTSDELSSFLIFSDSTTKIDGQPPASPDGQLKINIKDTIYVVKGYPWGNRIHFLHDPSQDITGFYIYVEGASYYHDVPETVVEDQYIPTDDEDTTSVVVLDFDLSKQNGRTYEDKNVVYPVTAEIKIQPHDKDGASLDEFTKWITIEDPESGENCNSIVEKTWEWNFTIRVNNGDVVNVWAPGLAIPINTKGGGCCNGDGKSLTTADIGCEVDINEPNMTWIEVYPNDFYVRPFEILHFYDGGKALAFQKEIIKNWDLFNTDFCGQALAYTFTVNDNFAREGEHDFIPGASHMKLNFPGWKGGWKPTGGDIVYTCNTLIIIFGVEGDAFLSVYKQWDGFSLIEDTQVIWHD